MLRPRRSQEAQGDLAVVRAELRPRPRQRMVFSLLLGKNGFSLVAMHLRARRGRFNLSQLQGSYCQSLQVSLNQKGRSHTGSEKPDLPLPQPPIVLWVASPVATTSSMPPDQ